MSKTISSQEAILGAGKEIVLNSVYTSDMV